MCMPCDVAMPLAASCEMRTSHHRTQCAQNDPCAVSLQALWAIRPKSIEAEERIYCAQLNNATIVKDRHAL